jgi:hypothetical protein
MSPASPGPRWPAQANPCNTRVRLLPYCGKVFGGQRASLGELDLPDFAGNEHLVDYTAVEVDMVPPTRH